MQVFDRHTVQNVRFTSLKAEGCKSIGEFLQHKAFITFDLAFLQFVQAFGVTNSGAFRLLSFVLPLAALDPDCTACAESSALPEETRSSFGEERVGDGLDDAGLDVSCTF